MIPYEVTLDRDGRLLTDWSMEDQQRRKLKGKLGMLEVIDRNQAVGSIIVQAGIGEIYYMKINGKVALRPRCCVGNGSGETVTFLERVTKKDKVEKPSRKDSEAPKRLSALRRDELLRTKVTFHHKKQQGAPV